MNPDQGAVLLVTPNWEGSLGFFCQRALTQLGFEVRVFDYRQEALGDRYRAHPSKGPLRLVRNRLGVALMNRRLLRTVEEYAPGLILVIKGELIEPYTVKALADKSSSVVVLWYPDASGYLIKRSYRRIAEGMAYYDISFLCDPEHVPSHVRPRIRHQEFLTFACDPEFHRPLKVSTAEKERYASKICFVGNPHGTHSLRDQTLMALHDYPLAIWGKSWEQTPLGKRYPSLLRGPAYGQEMLKVYSSSQIALNLSFARYIIFRNFEVPACGALLMTEDLRALRDFYRLDEEVVAFRNTDDLRAKLDYYLEHPDEIELIAQKGQQRTYAEHTFVHRMKTLVHKAFG